MSEAKNRIFPSAEQKGCLLLDPSLLMEESSLGLLQPSPSLVE
jgi:hypothetical protein